MPFDVPKYRVDSLSEKRSRTALIIPVINEGTRIIKQLEDVRRVNQPVDIIIADGGSTDGSLDDLDYLKEFGVRAKLTKMDKGALSAQLRMAFDYSLTQGYELFITMDGNGKDGPEGISTIQSALNAGYDFVQGSRYIKGGEAINTPISRTLAIRLVHAPLTSLGARFHYTDTTNGFRGFSRKFLKDDRVSIFRDVFQTYELLAYLPICAARLRFRCIEVPVRRFYPANGIVPTKIKGIRSQTNILRILINAATGKYNVKR